MSDGMLSQEEINALLNGMDSDQDKEESAPSLDTNEYLTDMEKDTLGEIGNISFGSSATALSSLLNQKVDITTPEVTVVEKNILIRNSLALTWPFKWNTRKALKDQIF